MHWLNILDWSLGRRVKSVAKEMNRVTRIGGRFKTETEGISNLTLLGLFSLYSSLTKVKVVVSISVEARS